MSKQRNQWENKSSFIISAIGAAVGLGNIWRFPYVIYKNGGGAFLIPYFFAIFTAGIPLLLLEYIIGHKYRASSPNAFRKARKGFEWFGWFPVISSILLVLYYASIVSWAMHYAIKSFNLGWGSDPANFFLHDFLRVTDSALNIGSINMPILFGNAIVWFSCWFVCYKEVKGIARLNKILLPILLISMLAITVRSLSLPGAVDGLNALFTPSWESLKNPDIWMSAYGQVFFSLSVAMGIMVTFSSYLPKKTDLNNSAFITSLSNSGFEFICAIAVFSIIGFMSNQQGIPVNQVSENGGIGLSFIVFPSGISQMAPGVNVFIGVAFFGSLIFAGITSLISLVEACSSSFSDKFSLNKKSFLTVFCILAFIGSSLFTTGAGFYILDIFDYFLNNYSIVTVGLFQTILFGWFFNLSELRQHANSISHFKIGIWWEICIKYILPVILTVMLITSIYNLAKNGYDTYEPKALIIYGTFIISTICISASVLTKLKGKVK